jgi:hypothetical protein
MPHEIHRTNWTYIRSCCEEHIQAIRTNRQNSKFAQHILDTGYTYNSIDQTTEILHIEKKGQKLNTLK